MKNEYLRVFRAFADANRIRVLELLCSGEQCACVLLDDMQISQPTLSHHMKILCESGIVKSRRVGKWNYYSIDGDGCEYGRRLLEAVAKRKMDWMFLAARQMRRFLRAVRKSAAFSPAPGSGCRCGS
jgi:ArsR family transcriptional regulator